MSYDILYSIIGSMFVEEAFRFNQLPGSSSRHRQRIEIERGVTSKRSCALDGSPGCETVKRRGERQAVQVQVID
jgi:hypothetical protein